MSAKPPVPTPQDLAAWRDLVAKARARAAHPDRTPVGGLDKAIKAARRSVVLGVLSRDNPCVVLVNLSRQFVSETDRGRRDLAPRLAQACDDVTGLLNGPAATSPKAERPTPRFRADIDG